MPSPTVENYVKEIFLLQQPIGSKSVPMGDIARAMDVAPGTATAMLKTLSASGLADYEPRHGTRLSEKGKQLALRMLRKHRIVELFLVDELGLDWSEVHVEAERMEHAVSEKVLKQMDAKLGHPTTDPHGDPIPTSEGALEESSGKALAECKCGENYIIARVGDQSVDFLQYLNERGLKPGATLTLVSSSETADAVTILSAEEHNITMGMKAAGKIFVIPDIQARNR